MGVRATPQVGRVRGSDPDTARSALHPLHTFRSHPERKNALADLTAATQLVLATRAWRVLPMATMRFLEVLVATLANQSL
jgi:hypothetical protein